MWGALPDAHHAEWLGTHHLAEVGALARQVLMAARPVQAYLRLRLFAAHDQLLRVRLLQNPPAQLVALREHADRPMRVRLSTEDARQFGSLDACVLHRILVIVE